MSEERHAHIRRGGFPAAFSEHFDMIVTMGTLQPTHVLNNPDDRDFAVLAERDRLAGIKQGHFLWRRHDHRAADIA